MAFWRGMDLVDALLSPLGFGLALALILWFARRRLPRWMLRAGFAIELVCLVLTTPFGANALVVLEERRAPPESACASPPPATIVVLSGGVRRDASGPADVGVLNAASLQRTLAAADLARRTNAAELVVTGGARDPEAVAQSQVMADLAERLGVPAARVRVEGVSQTTWENARQLRAMSPALPERIWLVTSALHMPRALIAFRAAGFAPCSYPADSLATPVRSIGDFLPSGGAVANASAALHEIVGEIAYRWRATRD